ncbi:MAG: hypothetical protein ACOY3Y_17605, partial [Acidobacteriota bacterium]
PGPFLLAARASAVIIPTFFTVDAERRFHVAFEEPFEVDGDGDLEAPVRAAMERWVRILERRIGANPTQWYCFYPFWGQPS